MKCHKKLTIVILLLTIFIIVYFTINFININKKYPDAQIIKIPFGETLTIDNNLEVKLNSTEYQILYDFFEENKELGINEEIYYSISDPNDAIIFNCEISIKNISDTKQDIELYNLIYGSDIWSNGISLEIFKAMNIGKSFIYTLNPFQEDVVNLPFIMYRLQFSDENWRNVYSDEYSITYSLYPLNVKLLGEEFSYEIL